MEHPIKSNIEYWKSKKDDLPLRIKNADVVLKHAKGNKCVPIFH